MTRTSFAVWMTGLPASGKSTITAMVRGKLAERGVILDVLESDELRRLLTPTPTYASGERDLFYRALALVGKRLAAHGICVIFDATATKRAYRDLARTWIPRFLEVEVACPLEVCMRRDPKGIYRRGRAGELTNVPGLHDPYEAPLAPEVRIESEATPPETAAAQVVGVLEERGWIRDAVVVQRTINTGQVER